MRTLAKTLEYLLLVGLCGGLCYVGSTYIGKAIGDSLNNSAEMIESAGRPHA